MNPCPCGYLLDPLRECRCTLPQVQRYQARLSGPLLDRLDIRLLVNPPQHKHIFAAGDSAVQRISADLRKIVNTARRRQYARQGCTNSAIPVNTLIKTINLDVKAQKLRDKIAKDLKLSARACHRMLRVARTIADLAASEKIIDTHLQETFTLIKPNKIGVFA